MAKRRRSEKIELSVPKRKDSLPAIAIGPTPVVLREGNVRTLSMAFLADLEEHYREKGRAIFDYILQNRPEQYFAALVALTKVHRVEADIRHQDVNKPRNMEEILQRLEEKGGPRMREAFERYLVSLKPEHS